MASRILVSLRVPASPERTFAAFTQDIGSWWRHNPLFAFTARPSGRLSFEGEQDGRLIETLPDGEVFEIGRVDVWAPPDRLVFGWRQATFLPEQRTEVEVRFEAVGAETRITVEHRGWDSVPQPHVARHGFPPFVFQQRHAEWWRALLDSLKTSMPPAS